MKAVRQCLSLKHRAKAFQRSCLIRVDFCCKAVSRQLHVTQLLLQEAALCYSLGIDLLSLVVTHLVLLNQLVSASILSI